MKTFSINQKIFEIFNDLHLGIVLCQNINNEKSLQAENLLNLTIQIAKSELSSLSNLTDLKVLQDWRNAYKKFNEKKNRSSIESLLRRIYNDKPVSSINPLVDIYNSISIKYKMPCGGEDIDKIPNNIELTISNGNESFLQLGSDYVENPNRDEIIYTSDNMVICRCFNWRESDICKLTSETKNAFLCIECLDISDLSSLESAIGDLSNTVADLLGGNCKSIILNKKNHKIEI